MMAEIMGFSGFDSTAGKGVDDPRCKMEGVHHKEQRRYRQYMNRRGGFNRPLDAV
jgi:U4/U6.U5 tri-snRNP-associated protein 3